jgi:hypothetical protein
VGERRRRALGRGQPRPRHRLRDADARQLSGAAAVGLAFPGPGLVASSAVPAAATLVAALVAGDGPAAAFRADALGIAAAVALAAFAGGGTLARLARIPAAALLLATARVALGSPPGAPAGGAVALAALAAGAMAATAGLRAAGERARCPAPAAGAAAAAVLWTACAGVWWADGLAAAVPAGRRGLVREAVLAVDPFTAAAYGVAGWDRLKDPDVYARTTVGTLPVRRPNALGTSAWWAATGLAAGAAAFATRPRRRGAGDAAVAVPDAGAGAP